jgi:predicted transcriptional regulator
MAARTVYVQPSDEPLWEWLTSVAETEKRSVSYMLARAIEEFREQRVSARLREEGAE